MNLSKLLKYHFGTRKAKKHMNSLLEERIFELKWEPDPIGLTGNLFLDWTEARDRDNQITLFPCRYVEDEKTDLNCYNYYREFGRFLIDTEDGIYKVLFGKKEGILHRSPVAVSTSRKKAEEKLIELVSKVTKKITNQKSWKIRTVDDYYRFSFAGEIEEYSKIVKKKRKNKLIKTAVSTAAIALLAFGISISKEFYENFKSTTYSETQLRNYTVKVMESKAASLVTIADKNENIVTGAFKPDGELIYIRSYGVNPEDSLYRYANYDSLRSAYTSCLDKSKKH